MTVQQLRDCLQHLINEGSGDMTVVIQAMTGQLRGSSNTNIESVVYGFDWDFGKVIINPVVPLIGAAYAEKRRESARKAGEREALKGKKK